MQYILTPHGTTGAVTEVTLSNATLKTVLQVAVPLGVFTQILGWGVSFTGTSAGDAPGQAYLMEGDTAATVTGQAPDLLNIPVGGQPSLCTSGAGSGFNATVEGSIAVTRMFDSQKVHPQTGYSVWFPSDARPFCGLIATARYLRIRVSLPTAYPCVPWIAWAE